VNDYPGALYFLKDTLGAILGAGARNNTMKYQLSISRIKIGV